MFSISKRVRAGLSALLILMGAVAWANPDEDLLEAIDQQQVERVRSLLNEDADVHARNVWGDTALMRAAKSGNLEMMSMLLDRGAAVDDSNYEIGYTALTFAAMGGHIEATRLLLRAGADPNRPTMYHENAASAAASIALQRLLENPGQFAASTSPVAIVSASSFLPDTKAAGRYSPAKALDGDPGTAWVEGVSDSGVFESLHVEFSLPITFDAIEVMPGYFDERYWEANNRVRTLSFSTESLRSGMRFDDEMTAQRTSLSDSVTVTSIEFLIDSIYQGSKWNDTCIAEIVFLWSGRRLEILAVDGGDYPDSSASEGP